jgi:hypothetical protein
MILEEELDKFVVNDEDLRSKLGIRNKSPEQLDVIEE